MHLKHLLLILLICLATTRIAAREKDDYIRYYNLCNEARHQLYLKHQAMALQYFDTALHAVDNPQLQPILNALFTAAALGLKEKTAYYLRMAVTHGRHPDVIKLKQFRFLVSEAGYKPLADSLPIYAQQYKRRLNAVYSRSIDSLYYIDQLLRNTKVLPSIAGITMATIKAASSDPDQALFLCLQQWIRLYGFPSERKISEEGQTRAALILHHNVRLPKNEAYLKTLYTALLQGEYNPEDYAWVYDQNRIMHNQLPWFYYGVADIAGLTAQQKQEINNRRRMHGIKPLEAFKVIRKGDAIIQLPLW